MSKIRFTNKAVGDLTSIWNYTVRTWSVQQAERYYNMLMNACGSLTEPGPDICRHYDDIMPGTMTSCPVCSDLKQAVTSYSTLFPKAET